MSENDTNKKRCATCGKLYKVCLTCEEARIMGYNFWRATCDRPECYQVHLILHDFYYDKISKEDARKILNEILTEDMLPYTDNARNLIRQIFTEDPIETVVKNEAEEVQIAESFESAKEEVPYAGLSESPEVLEVEEYGEVSFGDEM